jgi:putative phosphoesterase
MKIGIISDSHDNIWRLDEAIPHLQDCEAVLHCGDLIAPFMVKRLSDGLGEIPIHMVWGNNDGDQRLVTQLAAKAGRFTIYGELAEFEIDGLRIAMNHYPEVGKPLANSGTYDLVCFGHNHTASLEQIGSTVLLNPGEIMGLNGRSTLALFNTDSRTTDFVELGGG